MSIVPFIDAHIHADNRTAEDFDRLAVAGCTGLLAVAGGFGGFRSADSVLDHFRRLGRHDRARVEQAGLRCWLALGVHPTAIPEKGIDELLRALPDALIEYRAVAVGEIGLERSGELEEEVLARQLVIAADLGLGAIVHTPRQDKAVTVEKTLELIEQSPLAPGKVLLDHINPEVLPLVRASGCKLGLSIHPSKLMPDQAAALVADFGPAGFILSTDMGAARSFLFGIPAALSAMQDLGLSEESIRAVALDNLASFLGVDP